MGLLQSTQKGPDSQKAADNVRKLFTLEQSDDILDTLNIPELHSRNLQTDSINKIPLPIIGGKSDDDDDNSAHKIPGYNFMLGGAQTDIRFKSDRQRYLRYNIFNIIQKLEQVEQMYQQKNQTGGNDLNGPNGNDENEVYASISSDNEAIEKIKKLINKELTSLKNNQEGGCECNNPKPMVGGRKKSKGKAPSTPAKGKKLSRSDGVNKQYETSSSTSTSNDDSSDSDSSDSENGINSNSSLHNSSPEESHTESGVSSSQSETMSSQNGGLSIFPFNSSEVRSSRSEKNMKMIRRKI
jgi:hypothetical protein